MTRPLREYDRFTGAEGDAATVFLPRGRLNRLTKAAREAGYGAGFEAARAELNAAAGASAARIAERLEDIAFTQTEARRAVIDSLEPLLREVVAQLLPTIAAAALAPLVAEQVVALARTSGTGSVHVTCSQNDFADLEAAIGPALSSAAVQIAADPGLAPGSVRICAHDGERHIEFAAALRRIGAAVDEFFSSLPEESNAAV